MSKDSKTQTAGVNPPASLPENASLSQRIAFAGIELSQSDREILSELEARKEEKRRGVLNFNKPMSFGDFITANDSPNPFQLGNQIPAVTVKQLPQEQGA